MVCITCQSETQVINSRPQKRINQVWRRRRCVFCDTIFSTQEAPDYHKSIVVSSPSAIPKQSRLVPFERDKLLLSIYKSLAHRPDALRDAGGLCATIVAKLAPTAQNGSLEKDAIIRVTVIALTRFDKLAAQHYQALHKNR